MKRVRSALFLLPFVAVSALVPGNVRAADASAPDASAAAPVLDAADTARRAKVALRVGNRTMTVGELEDRIATIPPYQIGTLGASRDEVVRAFVDQVVGRDMILAAGAEARGLDKTLPWSHQLDRARSTATLRAVRAPFATPAAVPMDDVRRYYDQNKAYFDAPERINVWRILVKTREEASTILAAAKKDPTVAKYNDLAREHSIDKATNLRGGNLGFLAPDGTSNQAGLKADVALVKAAQAVKDGELVPDPVHEGDGFAVVWRRGTLPPSKRSLEDATAQIQTTLFRERTELAEKQLMDELRKKNVKDVDYPLLGIIELAAMDAGVGLTRTLPSARPSSSR